MILCTYAPDPFLYFLVSGGKHLADSAGAFPDVLLESPELQTCCIIAGTELHQAMFDIWEKRAGSKSAIAYFHNFQDSFLLTHAFRTLQNSKKYGAHVFIICNGSYIKT